jgi:hypothetical protein
VPSGRVGNAKDAIFRSNEHFRGAVGEREAADVAELEHRLDRRLEPAERARIGVTQLRRFLEQLLQRRCAPGGRAPRPLAAGRHGCRDARLVVWPLPCSCQLAMTCDLVSQPPFLKFLITPKCAGGHCRWVHA